MEAIAGILARNELGLPMWAWVLAGGGAILVVVYLKHRQGTSGTDQSVTGGPSAQTPASIDPYTGVPYSIESAINPATGLPAYYGVGSSGSSGNTPGVGGSGSGSTPPAILSPFQQLQGELQTIGAPSGQQSAILNWFGGLSQDQQSAFLAQPLAQQQASITALLAGGNSTTSQQSGAVARPSGMWPGPGTFR